MSDYIEFGWSQSMVFSNKFLGAVAVWGPDFGYQRTTHSRASTSGSIDHAQPLAIMGKLNRSKNNKTNKHGCGKLTYWKEQTREL